MLFYLSLFTIAISYLLNRLGYRREYTNLLINVYGAEVVVSLPLTRPCVFKYFYD